MKLQGLLTTAMLVADFTLKSFDVSSIVHIIVHAVVAVLVISGVIVGGQKMIESKASGDPKERSEGISTILWALVIGGVIEAVVAMVI